MAGTRKLQIEILGDAKGLSGAFGAAEKSAGGFAAKIGKAGLAIGAGILAGAGLAVGGLAKIGETFDAAYDAIRLGTGATGEALADLEKSFKTVATSVAGVSFEDASTAIADLNTRTGLAGKPLEDLSKQFLNLSKISKTDLAGNIGNLTRVFGDWGISVEDQAGSLDKIWRASQATGAGIDQLGTQVVQFGAPLRQLGFSFEESIAMLGKWEKEGVNTELVLGGMKKALGTFAKEGKDAPAALRELTAEIKAIQDPTEATQRAIEVFGLKAGPDMAAAIREGRFDIEDYVAAIENGSETIGSAADDTDDWREKLTLLKNKALVALEPLATKVFGAFNVAIEKATPYIERAVAWFSENMPKAIEFVRPYAEKFQKWFGENIPKALGTLKDFLVGAFEGGKKLIADMAEAFGTNEGTILKVLGGIAAGLVALAIAWNLGPGLIITGIVALVAGFLWAYENVEWFRDGVIKAMEWSKAAFDWLSDAAVWLWGKLQILWTKSEGLRAFLADAFVKGVQLAKGAFDALTTGAGWVIAAAQTVWDKTEGLRAFLADAFRLGVYVAITAFNFLKGAFNLTVDAVQAVWDKTEGLRAFLGAAFKLGIDAAVSLIGGLSRAFSGVVGFIQGIIDKAKAAIQWVKDLANLGQKTPTGTLIPAAPSATPGGSGVPHNARGGMAHGWSWVGEQGPELAYFGQQARIYPNGQSMAMANGGGGNVYVTVVSSIGQDEAKLAREIDRILSDRKRTAGSLSFA